MKGKILLALYLAIMVLSLVLLLVFVKSASYSDDEFDIAVGKAEAFRQDISYVDFCKEVTYRRMEYDLDAQEAYKVIGLRINSAYILKVKYDGKSNIVSDEVKVDYTLGRKLTTIGLTTVFLISVIESVGTIWSIKRSAKERKNVDLEKS